MTKTITAPDGGPIYCSPNSAMEIFLRFLRCAGQSVQLEDMVVSTKNEAYNDIFREYWNRADRKAVAVKCYEKRDGDTENKMVFTSQTTGATLTVHEKTWN